MINQGDMAVVLRTSMTILLACLCLEARADPRTVNDGVYTREQAKVGEKLYAEQCISCHLVGG